MKRRLARLALLLGIFSLSTPALAKNDQNVVIGLGVGLHNFSTVDELREGVLLFDDLSFAGLSQMYFEWYPLGEIGIGVRAVTLGVTEEIISSYLSLYEREVMVQNEFVTLHWVPMGGTGYARFGVLAGVGPSHYEYTETFGGISTSASSDGRATLVGAYVDWGGDGFGARLGFNSLKTDLDDLLGFQVDGSGTSYYVDLRWAF